MDFQQSNSCRLTYQESCRYVSIESSLHLMDIVTSSDLVDFELQARIPGSLGMPFAGIRSWFNFACHGHSSEVGTVVQTSQTDQSTCLVHDLSFRCQEGEMFAFPWSAKSHPHGGFGCLQLYNILGTLKDPGAPWT